MGDVTSSITDAAVASMMPAVEQILVEKVMPMMIVGMVAGAVAAAFIGTWFGVKAARASGGIRRNLVSNVYIRRRSA
jgi:hypothetical protein